MTLTTERQQFEEWFKFHSDEEECTNLLQRNSAGTNYLHPHTDLAWIAWKASREVLANREAQPVAYAVFADNGNIRIWSTDKGITENVGVPVPLYTTPPAPAVPDEAYSDDCPDLYPSQPDAWAAGFNACRAAMLAQPVSSGYKLNSPVIPDGWKLVPVDPTKEMINAALAAGAISIRTAYSAMLAAAPEGGNG